MLPVLKKVSTSDETKCQTIPLALLLLYLPSLILSGWFHLPGGRLRRWRRAGEVKKTPPQISLIQNALRSFPRCSARMGSFSSSCFIHRPDFSAILSVTVQLGGVMRGDNVTRAEDIDFLSPVCPLLLFSTSIFLFFFFLLPTIFPCLGFITSSPLSIHYALHSEKGGLLYSMKLIVSCNVPPQKLKCNVPTTKHNRLKYTTARLRSGKHR